MKSSEMEYYSRFNFRFVFIPSAICVFMKYLNSLVARFNTEKVGFIDRILKCMQIIFCITTDLTISQYRFLFVGGWLDIGLKQINTWHLISFDQELKRKKHLKKNNENMRSCQSPNEQLRYKILNAKS